MIRTWKEESYEDENGNQCFRQVRVYRHYCDAKDEHGVDLALELTQTDMDWLNNLAPFMQEIGYRPAEGDKK